MTLIYAKNHICLTMVLFITQQVLFCWQPYNCVIIALWKANSVCACSYVRAVRDSVGSLLYDYIYVNDCSVLLATHMA